jgi:hypothetical protein
MVFSRGVEVGWHFIRAYLDIKPGSCHTGPLGVSVYISMS